MYQVGGGPKMRKERGGKGCWRGGGCKGKGISREGKEVGHLEISILFQLWWEGMEINWPPIQTAVPVPLPALPHTKASVFRETP